MHTGNNIIIEAPRQEIFQIVSDIKRWPERLPHYRYVRIVGEDGPRDIAEMSAYCERTPISWVSLYERNPDTMEMRFEHTSRWTKGMVVMWYLTPTRDATRVEIIHDLRFRVPLLRWLAEPIIARIVTNIATKTLAGFKKFIEAGRATPPESAR